MIPRKLTLKNFMSYGEERQVLDFDGLHVACLSGDNGNGKSALLDAMTWALWGKTRASGSRSTTDDDIIHLGSNEAEVRFEFELNDAQFRVTKRRRLGKNAGAGDWVLAQCDTSGEWHTVGGTSSRETKEQITALLSMEYDTFINSAYLKQGQADEFTRQTPDSRKRILGEILNLDRFERLEAKAKERKNAAKEIVEELEREIKFLDDQIGRAAGYEEKRTEAQARLAELQIQIEAKTAEVEALREQKLQFDAVSQRVVDLQAAHGRTLNEIATRRTELGQKELRLETMQATIAQKDSILTDYRLLLESQKRREDLEPQMAEAVKKEKEYHDAKAAIDVEKTRLFGEIGTASATLKSLEQQCQELERLETQIAQLEKEITAAGDLTAKFHKAEQDAEIYRQQFAELGAKKTQLDVAIKEIDDVLSLLERPHAVCPICDTDLKGKHERVLKSQNDKKALFTVELNEVKAQGRTAKQNRDAAQERLATLKVQNDALTAKCSALEDRKLRRASLAQLPAERARARATVQKLQTQYDNEDYALPQRARVKSLEGQVQILGLAKSEYETVVNRIARLKETESRRHDLKTAEENWANLSKEREALISMITAKQNEADKEQGRLADLKMQLTQYDTIRNQFFERDAEAKRLEQEAQQYRVAAESYTKYLADIKIAETQKAERIVAYKKSKEEMQAYNALVSAFGRSGVQSLIIENAIPELETETNDLLSRMTDNAMQVRFEMTRSAKTTKSEVETLDIKVQDDAGVRPYELFSGGEGFRINFAIRIALSRLLARRSGARLQTLIMDEGFGSQDGKGRERLVEIIESIKDDFAKIIVITHFEELKDSFAQRIEVIKDAGGSRIHVL